MKRQFIGILLLLAIASATAQRESFFASEDTLSTQEKLLHFVNAKIKEESKKKEAENKRLLAEQLENHIIIERQRFQNYVLLIGIVAMVVTSFTLFKAVKRKKENNLLLEQEVYKRTQQINASNEELIHFNRQLEQSNKELERFAYIASHDLKAPLRNIISFTNLIERKVAKLEDKEMNEYLHYVIENARQMNSLIRDVLEFSQLDLNETYEYEPTDLNDSLYLAIKNLQEKIAVKNAVVSAEALPTIRTSSMHIVQILQNLIGNGLKYNENPYPEVYISYNREKGSHCFAVKDNGIGIDRAFHDQIFEMFRRLHTSKHYKGTGIGLAICQKIIQKMNGRIWLESETGKGSTFYFTVPGEGESHSIVIQ